MNEMIKPIDALRDAICHYSARVYGEPDPAKASAANDVLAGLHAMEALWLDREDCHQRIRQIGRLVGCGHTEDPDGRRQLVTCVEETLNAIPFDATKPEWPRLPITPDEVRAAEAELARNPVELPEALRDPASMLEAIEVTQASDAAACVHWRRNEPFGAPLQGVEYLVAISIDNGTPPAFVYGVVEMIRGNLCIDGIPWCHKWRDVAWFLPIDEIAPMAVIGGGYAADGKA